MEPYDSMTYEEYQHTPWWSQMRQKRLEIDGHCCAMCGTQESSSDRLQLHHRCYPERGTEVVEDCAAMLCRKCHAIVSRIQRQEVVYRELEKVLNYAEGARTILDELYTDALGNWCAKTLIENGINIPSEKTNIAASIMLNAMYGINGMSSTIRSSLLYPGRVFFPNTDITKYSAFNKVQKAIKYVREKRNTA